MKIKFLKSIKVGGVVREENSVHDFSEEHKEVLLGLMESGSIEVLGMHADELDEESITLAEALANTTAERDAALKAAEGYKEQVDKVTTCYLAVKEEAFELTAKLEKANSEIATLKADFAKAQLAQASKKGGK